MLQHDVTSPNVYSRIHKISGTKGSALKYPDPPKIALSHEGWLRMKNLKTAGSIPATDRKNREMAKQVGGHGGMDFFDGLAYH